jgi:hypothetical protein
MFAIEINIVMVTDKHRNLLKHLKCSGVDLDDVLHFYYSVVKPVLEYACPAWHTGLTRDQSDRLEAVQKRSLSIIFNMSVSENYKELLQ